MQAAIPNDMNDKNISIPLKGAFIKDRAAVCAVFGKGVATVLCWKVSVTITRFSCTWLRLKLK